MTPKEKAEELVFAYIPYVYCFVGSGMLSNDYDEKMAKENAKKCAAIAVDKLSGVMDNVAAISNNYFRGTETGGYVDADVEENYWKSVKSEIEKL